MYQKPTANIILNSEIWNAFPLRLRRRQSLLSIQFELKLLVSGEKKKRERKEIAERPEKK